MPLAVCLDLGMFSVAYNKVWFVPLSRLVERKDWPGYVEILDCISTSS